MKNKTIVAIASIFALATSTIQTAQATLYGQWLFNNAGNGTNVLEQTGAHPFAQLQSFTAGASNAASYVSSPGGAALHFVNTGDQHADLQLYFGKPTPDELPASFSNAISVAYWVKPSVNSIDYLTLLQAGGSTGFNFTRLNNSLQYGPGSPPYTDRRFNDGYAVGVGGTATLLSAGAWHHLVYTYGWDGVTRTDSLYIDGAFATSGTYSSPNSLDFTGVAVRFGIVPGSGLVYRFDGDLDQLELYDSTLSGSQVSALFSAGPSTVPEPTAVALLGLGGLALLLRRRRDG